MCGCGYSGGPEISGTAQVGVTLTADTSDIEDPDGLTSATFIHQWLADGSVISGATGTTYTPGDEDVVITLSTTGDCTDYGAICTDDGRKLSSPLELTVAGPR